MICPHCQKIIAEDSTKCPFCSEPFRENEGVVIKKHYAKKYMASTQFRQPKLRRNRQ